MQVLVTGATGAIGSALVAALRRAGCDIVAASRHPPPGGLPVDLAMVPSRDWWEQQLRGVDVVVNAAGILQEHGAQRFDTVHARGPIELFHGCVAARVRHVVQVSALGADEEAATPFHRSKKAADDTLRGLPVAATIVQPSLVYRPGVASSALFDQLAAWPWIALPRGGAPAVQPVTLEDAVEGLVHLVLAPAAGHRTVAFVGPRPITLRRYLEQLRERQGAAPHQRVLPLPDNLSLAAARLMQALPGSAFTQDAIRMLLRGNTAAAEPFSQLLGRPPRDITAGTDSQADAARRRSAILAQWLVPLRSVVALLWIWTGLVSLGLYPASDSLALLASVGVTGLAASLSLYGAAALDLALGVAVWCTRGRQRRWVWLAQLGTMAGYTVILSVQAPQWWVHPFGPLSKNLPLAGLIGLLWALEPLPRRGPSPLAASAGRSE